MNKRATENIILSRHAQDYL